jgi:mRNA interferase MazF
MMLARGDVVAAVVPGDFGKPRPVVIVQAAPFLESHASITVCPLTAHLTGLRLFRIMIAPDQSNGLNEPSEVMVDKVSTLRRDRIAAPMGKLAPSDMRAIDTSLRGWLALG